MRAARIDEDEAFDELSKVPGMLCSTLQQFCGEMVQSRIADEERRTRERKIFFDELNKAQMLLAETEAALERETGTAREVDAVSSYVISPFDISLDVCW